MSEYVDVKDLPDPVLNALKAVGYSRSNIEVRTEETVVLGTYGPGNGHQAFAALVNLDTGEHVVRRGSWGGINAFNRENPVDNDQNPYPLPPNGVAITGSRGGTSPTYATLHIPTTMVSRILTAGPTEELQQVEKDGLYCYACIRSGPYRREELKRRNVPAGVVDDLVTRGLLKRNGAGATQITTAGRNAVMGYRDRGY
jgi:hypothetical protein